MQASFTFQSTQCVLSSSDVSIFMGSSVFIPSLSCCQRYRHSLMVKFLSGVFCRNAGSGAFRESHSLIDKETRDGIIIGKSSFSKPDHPLHSSQNSKESNVRCCNLGNDSIFSILFPLVVVSSIPRNSTPTFYTILNTCIVSDSRKGSFPKAPKTEQ